MTCKECVHYEVCLDTRERTQMLAYLNRKDVEKICKYFQEKTEKIKKYRIVRCYGGTKGYGKTFDTKKDAMNFIATDEKIQEDKKHGFYFDVEVEE